MKLNFLFLTKLLVSVFLVCGVMFFAGCGDDDDEKIDGGKTGEIAGVYKCSYNGVMLHIVGSTSGTGYYSGEQVGDEPENFTWTSQGDVITIDVGYRDPYDVTFDRKDTISGGEIYNTYVRVK
ncbi:MAG: hypothetical protein FWF51_11285 [Chitinivibrionia bacterium]|nr:hypothetical protein [Chitinivibrionia bacterium]